MPSTPQVLTDAFLLLNSVNLSDHVKQIELSQSIDMQDATAMSMDTKTSRPGLKDWSLKITFHQDYAAAKIDQTITPFIGAAAGIPIEVRASSAARSTTNPGWTGTGHISDYNPVAGNVGDEQLCELTIQAGSTLVRNTA